jgi:transposase
MGIKLYYSPLNPSFMAILRYGIGVDMAMDKFQAAVCSIDAAGLVVVKASRTFSNAPKGFAELLAWKERICPEPVNQAFLMEATGIYHEALAGWLHDQGCVVCVVLPNKAKEYKKSLGLRSKTDDQDARALARMCCEQHLPRWTPMSKAMYGLRSLTRQVEATSKEISRVKCRLHAQKRGLYPTKIVINCLTAQLRLLEKQKQHLQKEVAAVISSDAELKRKSEQICRIKGVGLQSVAVIIAETNGFALFENIAQLVSYAGYDVVENQSGKHKGKTKISKQGNSHIRRILHLPALNVVRYRQSPFVALYERIFEKSKQKMKGYTAVQKKLLVMIYTLWKNDVPYNPDHGKTSKDAETAPSFAPVEQGTTVKKVALPISNATQDEHPSKHQRMPSFATAKLKNKRE